MTTTISALFKELYTQFEPSPLEDKDTHFGIVQCHVAEETVSLVDMEYEFIFMLDRSTSMNQRCADGKTKLYHVIHTMKNILGYLCEHPTIRHHIIIETFDDDVHLIVERCVVNADTYPNLIHILNKVKPDGSTNIEAALNSIKKRTLSLDDANANKKIVQLFMTDGYATMGETNSDLLFQLVLPNVTNIFIGLGIDHDTSLLEKLSNIKQGSYYFIDALEKSNIVYGEIMHDLLFQRLQRISLHVTQGSIYDYVKNQWLDTLSIDYLSSGAIKTFHLQSSCPTECVVTLTGETVDGTNVSIPLTNRFAEPLTKYVFRQKTLEHLYDVRMYFRNHPIDHSIDNHSMEKGILKKNIKDKLTAFLEELKQYRTEHDLLEDPFYGLLEEDIAVTLKMFDTMYASMFSWARQTSQGSQRGYSANLPVMNMQSASQMNWMGDYEDLFTQVKQYTPSPYLTKAVNQFTQTMDNMGKNK